MVGMSKEGRGKKENMKEVRRERGMKETEVTKCGRKIQHNVLETRKKHRKG